MGGNVLLLTGERAEKLRLSLFENENEFKKFKYDLKLALKQLNSEFRKTTKKSLWKYYNKVSKENKIFSGSSRLMFSKEYNDLLKYKSIFGDVDLQVPSYLMKELRFFLETHKDENFNEFKFKGFTSNGTQINCIFETSLKYTHILKHIQIDFEGVEFENNEPTRFATFGHYSSWNDTKKGIKGLFIKYLMRSLVSSIKTQEAVVIGKSGRKLKRDPIQSTYCFSVDYGLRLRLNYVFVDKDIKITNNLPTFTEIPLSERNYTSNLDIIFEYIFNRLPENDETNDLFSFTKTLSLMSELPEFKIIEVYERFIQIIWGKGAQGIERNNPELDKEIKMKAYNEFITKFPFLSTNNDVLINKYYTNYRMVKNG